MTQAIDALEKYLAESAVDLDAKRKNEFTVQDFIEMMLAKHGRVVSRKNARYQLSGSVTEGKLKCRRIPIGGKFVNVYSTTTN